MVSYARDRQGCEQRTDGHDRHDDGPTPGDGNLVAPDTDAREEQVEDQQAEDRRQNRREAEADEPQHRRTRRFVDAADLFGHRPERLVVQDERWPAAGIIPRVVARLSGEGPGVDR